MLHTLIVGASAAGLSCAARLKRATGYETGLEKIILLDQQRWADIKLRIKDRKFFGDRGLYFCGFHVSAGGMLREINLESKLIVQDIIRRTKSGLARD